MYIFWRAALTGAAKNDDRCPPIHSPYASHSKPVMHTETQRNANEGGFSSIYNAWRKSDPE